MTVYNVLSQVVGLVEADSPEEAQRIQDAHVEKSTGLSIYDIGGSKPFESESGDVVDLPRQPAPEPPRWR